MKNYLIFKERAAAFRADPEVAAALAATRVAELSEPTLASGESLTALRTEEFDPEAAAKRGKGVELLDQLALEHLFGVR
jgi:xylose isomerase